jgi:hypothetical protein
LAKNSQVQIEARCYRKGGDGLLVTNPEDALNYALNFPALLRESPSILQVICKPYQDLLSFPTAEQAIDMMVLQRQQRALQEVWEIFQQKSKSVAQLKNILLNPMGLRGVSEDNKKKAEDLKKWLEYELDIIAEKATKYANNPQDIRFDSSDFPPILSTRRLVELKLGLGVNYTNLSDLLFAKKWKEADEETRQLLLKYTNREEEGFLDLLDIDPNFFDELRIIDQLWLKYSNNRFGFSVQKQIWVELGGKFDGSFDYDIFCKLGDKLGWRKDGEQLMYSDVIFSTYAPRGHLPVGRGMLPEGRRIMLFCFL